MKDKYNWILDRYQELTEMISQSEVIADPPRYQQALKERSSLEKKAQAWEAYQTLLEHLDQARQMAEDPELAEIAEAEVRELTEEKEKAEYDLQLLLLPEDPDDTRSVVMEIRAGAGGEEACLFAADLMRLYEHFAARHHFTIEPVSLNDTELGGAKEAVFIVSGQGAYSLLKFESGVHRVQRVPVTDSTGKKQTSTCTVAV
ncbi:MAG: PCRF domain-containing protein, partial [Clostridia bacterium]|nr:PCRF domain-containing protein [Clostridia bacterium]